MNTTNPLARFSQAALLALLSLCTIHSRAADFTLTKTTLDKTNGFVDFSVSVIDGYPVTLQPGDKIYIEAHTRPQIVLSRVTQGTASAPITITNLGGQFIVDSNDSGKPKGFTLSGCRHFVLKGTEVAGDFGIKIARTPSGASGLVVTQHGGSNGVPLTGSSDFELSDIQIANTGFAGVFIKCDSLKASSGFVMQNVKIHDLHISNTHGEGMYIGYHAFHDSAFDAHEIRGIEIHNNTITNTGWDGIQLGCATQNASIHHNEITGYGLLAPNWEQDEGIRANPGTAADIYANKITGSSTLSGTGIFANPYNTMKIYNNLIITPEEAGIVVSETWQHPRGYVTGYSVSVFNNTIVSPEEEEGVRFARMHHSGMNYVKNNIITQASGNYIAVDSYSESVVEDDENDNVTATTAAAIGFVNASAHDYELTATSPAVNTGVNLTSSSVLVDLKGVSRPQGPAFDHGAFEFVATAPVITAQPSSQTVLLGSDVVFSVVANGAPSLSYQWKKNGVNITGATDDALLLNNVAASASGAYTVVVTNNLGSATSAAATLTVDSNVVTGIVTPAAWAQAGSAYCPAAGAFNEQPTWDSANARPSGNSSSAYTSTGTAYANRYWYIDFGPNYANVRITGSWTRYMPLTTGSYSGFGAMWWDDDNDSTNDNGVAATGINFCTGQNLNTGSAQLWVRDTNNASTPVAPQGRYLIIHTGPAPAARVNEFALSGYILN
jgi:hypothetical protein